MIRYLSEGEKERSKALYCEAFPEDSEQFVEYYYSYITKDNRILVLEQEGTVCSMLHLNPYRLSVNGTAVDAYYYVAVATKASCRHQGMMRSLISKSLKDIHREGHPFAYLMPADRAIYEPFDFRIVYQQKKVELPMDPQRANEQMAKLFDVYTLRDDWYMEKLAEEARVCAGEPPFEIIPYIMARITHVENMLSLLRSQESLEFVVKISDEIIEENDGYFHWRVSSKESVCEKMEESHQEILKEAVFVTIHELTEFVFGKRMIPGMEKVQTLKRICINESV